MINQEELEILKKKAAEISLINNDKIDFNRIANTFPSVDELNEMEPPLVKETYLLSQLIRSSIPYVATINAMTKPYVIAALFYQIGYMQAMKQIDERREEEVKYGPNS